MPERPPMTAEQDHALRAAIAAAAHGSMVSSFVVVAETTDVETGEPLFEDITPDEQPIWITMGLLEMQRAALQGHIARVDADNE